MLVYGNNLERNTKRKVLTFQMFYAKFCDKLKMFLEINLNPFHFLYWMLATYKIIETERQYPVGYNNHKRQKFQPRKGKCIQIVMQRINVTKYISCLKSK